MSEIYDRGHVAEQLIAKTWDELEVLEDQQGQLLFAERLFKRERSGKWKTIPIRMRVPREPDVREARIQARELATEQKLDPDKDPERFETLDTICLLWRCLREPSAPFEPIALDPGDLEKRFDAPVLEAAFARLEQLRRLVDPRPDELTDGELLALIAAIAKERSIRPLVACAGRSQDHCVVFMACQLAPYLPQLSSSESSEPSTPERSAPMSSG